MSAAEQPPQRTDPSQADRVFDYSCTGDLVEILERSAARC